MPSLLIGRIFLALGDLLALYLSLLAALFIRYQDIGIYFWDHIGPFGFIFLLWIVIFYIAGLYDSLRLRNNLEFFKTIAWAVGIGAIFAMVLFYLVPGFSIAPKRTLALFVVIFFFLALLWRPYFNRILLRRGSLMKALVINEGGASAELYHFLQENPQLGIQATLIEVRDLAQEITQKKATHLIVPLRMETHTLPVEELTRQKIKTINLPRFFSDLIRKVPLSAVDEGWILTHLRPPTKYMRVRALFDYLLGFVLFILLSPVMVLVVALIKITSPGPAIFKQVRVGESGKNFELYKFRTMRIDAEKAGAQWAKENDPRVTPFGKILRRTHIDEFPQLINILRGELSFIGPRPERPEFTTDLAKQIPFYHQRHIIKPGITGWAQVSYPYGSSVEDAREKLQYEIYYISNMSLLFDIAIFLKTIKTFFINPSRR